MGVEETQKGTRLVYAKIDLANPVGIPCASISILEAIIGREQIVARGQWTFDGVRPVAEEPNFAGAKFREALRSDPPSNIEGQPSDGGKRAGVDEAEMHDVGSLRRLRLLRLTKHSVNCRLSRPSLCLRIAERFVSLKLEPRLAKPASIVRRKRRR